MGPDHLSKLKFKGLLSFLVLFSACKQTRSVFKTLFILFFGYLGIGATSSVVCNHTKDQ